MSKPTEGKWEGSFPYIVAFGEKGAVICHIGEPRPKSGLVEYERLEIGSPNWDEVGANVNLIVTAVNACKEINKEHPERAARQIGAAFKALKDIREYVESKEDIYIQPEDAQVLKALTWLVLAAATDTSEEEK